MIGLDSHASAQVEPRPVVMGAMQLQDEGAPRAEVPQHGVIIFLRCFDPRSGCLGSWRAYWDLPVSTPGGFLSETPFLSLMRLFEQGLFPVLITHYQLQSCC